MAVWAHGRRDFGFMSSGCSEDDHNTNYFKHSLSVQSVLPVAAVPFSIHWKSDVTSSGYESAAIRRRRRKLCPATPWGGNLSVTAWRDELMVLELLF